MHNVLIQNNAEKGNVQHKNFLNTTGKPNQVQQQSQYKRLYSPNVECNKLTFTVLVMSVMAESFMFHVNC